MAFFIITILQILIFTTVLRWLNFLHPCPFGFALVFWKMSLILFILGIAGSCLFPGIILNKFELVAHGVRWHWYSCFSKPCCCSLELCVLYVCTALYCSVQYSKFLMKLCMHYLLTQSFTLWYSGRLRSPMLFHKALLNTGNRLWFQIWKTARGLGTQSVHQHRAMIGNNGL